MSTKKKEVFSLSETVRSTERLGLNFSEDDRVTLSRAPIPNKERLLSRYPRHVVVAVPSSTMIDICSAEKAAEYIEFDGNGHPFQREPSEAGLYLVSGPITSRKDVSSVEGIHPAILTLALVVYYRTTKEWLWEDRIYMRTDGLFKNGRSVYLGVDIGKIRMVPHEVASMHTLGDVCVQKFGR